MSKKLSEEQESYTKLFRELQELSEQKEEKLNKMTLLDTKNLMGQYKDEISFSGVKTFFSDWVADTPEEIEIIEVCKSNIIRNVKFCAGLGFLASAAFTSKFYLVVYADYLPFRPRMVSQIMGIFLGGLYGIIISNKPNLQRFDHLGTDYLLGRIARDEIMQWGSENTVLERHSKER